MKKSVLQPTVLCKQSQATLMACKNYHLRKFSDFILAWLKLGLNLARWFFFLKL